MTVGGGEKNGTCETRVKSGVRVVNWKKKCGRGEKQWDIYSCKAGAAITVKELLPDFKCEKKANCVCEESGGLYEIWDLWLIDWWTALLNDCPASGSLFTGVTKLHLFSNKRSPSFWSTFVTSFVHYFLLVLEDVWSGHALWKQLQPK